MVRVHIAGASRLDQFEKGIGKIDGRGYQGPLRQSCAKGQQNRIGALSLWGSGLGKDSRLGNFFLQRVRGGTQLAQLQLDLANAFVQRPEFLTKYPASLDGPSFVNAVLATLKNDIGADLTSQSLALIDLFNQGGRGAVIYRLADDNVMTNPINNRAFIDEEYNRAFVFTQYAGYLRRDSDIGGFLFWLGQVKRYPLRNGDAQHAMLCSFITSAEYQLRFGPVVSRTNGECPQ